MRDEERTEAGGDRVNTDDGTEFPPPGPAWAVGADGEHQGTSGMGPGEDRPGFGEEVDPEDAEGVAGGFLKSEPPRD